MSVFAAVHKAKVSKSGSFFLDGSYKVEIQRVKLQESSKTNKEYTIIEAKVLETTNDERPPGMECTQVIDMTNVMGPVNVKQFLCAISNVDSDDDEANEKIIAVWKELAGGVTMDIAEICEFICSEDNPLAGYVLNLECRSVKTKAGNPFTKHIWRSEEQPS